QVLADALAAHRRDHRQLADRVRSVLERRQDRLLGRATDSPRADAPGAGGLALPSRGRGGGPERGGPPPGWALVLLRGDVPAAGTGSSSASAAEIRRSYSASAGRSSARRASISALIFTSSSPAIRLPGSRAWRSTQGSAVQAAGGALAHVPLHVHHIQRAPDDALAKGHGVVEARQR